jgi:hypothetical protein
MRDVDLGWIDIAHFRKASTTLATKRKRFCGIAHQMLPVPSERGGQYRER